LSKEKKQTLLKIGLPDGKPILHASDFREMMAKAGDGSALLPSSFFNYGEDGRPLSSTDPDIRFVGGKSWVGILSMTADSPLIDQAAGIAVRVASGHFKRPLPMTIESKAFSLEEVQYPVMYYLRDMAIKRRTEELRNEPTEQLARRRIESSLARIAGTHGFDLPVASRLNIVFHNIRELGMHLRTSNGKSNEYVTLVNAEVSMHLNLKGMWQVCNLPSRGHGRLIKQGEWNGGGK